jgi:ABC-type Fe3+/spermidine/putrescine transport system ATPase subunit
VTGVAVAVVTHDLRRAALVCDRIAVLEAGRLMQVDTRDRVLGQPVSPSVARLVGMTNLVPAVLDGTGAAVVDPEHRLPTSSPLPSGSSVWVGVRPEHLKVDVGRGEGQSIGKATVVAHVSDGVVTTLDLQWAGLPLRTHLVAGRGLAREISIGNTVSLSVRSEDVHVLSRDVAPADPTTSDSSARPNGHGTPA